MKKPYKGNLTRPVPLPPDGQSGLSRMDENLDELVTHYGIELQDRHKWFKLAVSLAHDHVPSLRYQKPSGRPTTWTLPNQVLLDARIRRLILTGEASSIRQACKTIAAGYTKSPETIRDVHRRFNSSAVGQQFSQMYSCISDHLGIEKMIEVLDEMLSA